jgi:hypothetical protein
VPSIGWAWVSRRNTDPLFCFIFCFYVPVEEKTYIDFVGTSLAQVYVFQNLKNGNGILNSIPCNCACKCFHSPHTNHSIPYNSQLKTTRYWYDICMRLQCCPLQRSRTRMCQRDSIEHVRPLYLPFAAFGGAGLMDSSFLLLLGAGANKKEIRCSNQPLQGPEVPVNANNNSQSADCTISTRPRIVHRLV